MERKETNRARQLSIDKEFQKGVKIIDVDTAIADYMSKVIIPDLDENGNLLKVPLIYGNAERWTNARQQGYLRDQRGRVQIPLVMFKRNSIEKDESLPHFREVITRPFAKKYSQKNRYDRFSIMTNAKPTYEFYNIAIPAYVTVIYEVVVWTAFTEHMNKIIEQFQNESEKYWGTENGFKFRSVISSFETTQDLAGGSERIIRTTFNVNVSAYLLPDQVNNKPTVNKAFSPKRVVFGIETDLSGGGFTGANLYNEYAEVINFVAIRGSQMAVFVNASTAKLINVRLPLLPAELNGVFDVENWFRVYINGDFISPSFYSYTFNGATNEIIFGFNNLSFSLDNNDEIAVTGKFLQVEPSASITTTTTTQAPTTTTTTTSGPTTTTTTMAPALQIGDSAFGGIVAWIIPVGYPGYVPGEQHGLIISPFDLSSAAPWGCKGTSIEGTSGELLTGATNTNLIIAGCTTPNIAAKICADININGYSDWYLPSYTELFFIAQNKGAIDSNRPIELWWDEFANADYWSSTQFDYSLATKQTFARRVNLGTGAGNSYGVKDSNARVRPVRTF
jgi:hypothetical protein